MVCWVLLCLLNGNWCPFVGMLLKLTCPESNRGAVSASVCILMAL